MNKSDDVGNVVFLAVGGNHYGEILRHVPSLNLSPGVVKPDISLAIRSPKNTES